VTKSTHRPTTHRFIAAVIALLALTATEAFCQTVVFTKTLKKVNGVVVSGTPAFLTNGDTLDWVITYEYNPNPVQPAQTDIKDPFSPILQFVPNSLQVPPSWTKQWLSGSTWGAPQPVAATGVGAVIAFPNVTPIGAGQTALVPAPPAGSISTVGGGGDGYHAVPLGSNVYVINHHIAGTYLKCFDATTGATCINYPAHVPLAAGTYVGNASGDNTTPYKTYEYRSNNKLYFAVQKSASPFDYGILCADVSTQQSCGFVSLGTGAFGAATFQGMGGVAGKVYMQLPNGKIGCLDTTLSVPCTGQPFSSGAATTYQPLASSSEIVGTRIYSTWETGSASAFLLTCFDTTSDLPCSGWGTKTPDSGGAVGILYPLLNAGGTVTGICTHTTSPAAGAFVCYDISTGALVPSSGSALPNPSNYATWAKTFGGGPLQTLGLGQSGYYKARVFNGHTPGEPIGNPAPNPSIGCYDFAAPTPGPCGEPAWPVHPPLAPLVTNSHYATVADPGRPGCMWYYGDDGRLGSFQAANGMACSGSTTLDTTITPADSYCAGDSTKGWDKLSLMGLTLGGGITATLTLYDGNNPGQLAMLSGVPYAQNLPIASLPLTLGSTGLGIGYGIGNGNYTSLDVVLQFSGITSNAAWTQSPPPSVEVSWLGGPPQFCFQTKVATCDNGNVTNQASAVTKPASGPQINSVAPNPPFSVAHVTGADCPAKLTVTKNVVGAPAGFTGTFNFNITCSTSGGLVQQQVSIAWPNTTITLPGVQAGSTCTVSEDPTLPPLSSGYSWSGVPTSVPASGVIHITSGGPNQIGFTNVVRHCDDRGKVKITKLVPGAPAGFAGTFTFSVACWSGTTLITQQAQITVPGQSSVTINGIPTGSSCTVNETGPLPALPVGWFWLSPSYQPPSGTVSLIGNCCPEVIVTDAPSYCCPGGPGAADASGAATHKPE
jgi:hypothetical protein